MAFLENFPYQMFWLSMFFFTSRLPGVYPLLVTNFDPSNPVCSTIDDPDHYWDFSGRSDHWVDQTSSTCTADVGATIFENGAVVMGSMTGNINAGGAAMTFTSSYPSNPEVNSQICAVQLDNDYVDFGTVNLVCLGSVGLCTSGFSLSLWLRYGLANNALTERYIFNTGGHTESGRGFSVSVEPSPASRLVFEMMAPAGVGFLNHLVYKSAFPDDTWFHAIFVYDNPTDTGTIYINGLPVVPAEQQSNVIAEAAHTATDFHVGGPNDDTGSASKRATVAISDMFVYYRALNATEVRDFHECQNPDAFLTTLPPSTIATTTLSALVQLQDIHDDGRSEVYISHGTTLGDLRAFTAGHGDQYTLDEMKIIAETLSLVAPMASQNRSMTTDFLGICSDVFDSLEEDRDDKPQVISFLTGKFMYLLDSFVERVATAHDCDDPVLEVDTPNIDLKVECAIPDDLDATISQSVLFDSGTPDGVASIVLPIQEIQAPVRVAILVYSNLRDHISNKAIVGNPSCPEDADGKRQPHQTEVTVGGDVTSFIASSDLGAIKNFNDKSVHIYLRNDEIPSESRALCGHWMFHHNEQGGIWSDEGCVVEEDSSDKSYTTCKCSHLTNFAVLMQVSPNEIPLSPGHSIALENLTYICSCCSIFCLLMTLGCYSYLRLWKSQRIILHGNLAVSLAIAQTTYLLGIEAKPEPLCTMVAVLLHYFFTASFSWMLIEGANLYIKSIFVFAKEVPTLGLVAAGWGMPAIIVGIALGIRFEGYGRDGVCWLSFEDGLIWAFAGPVIFVILANAVILILVLRVFMTLKANADKTDVQRLRVGIRAIVMLQPLLGLTWLFGAFAINEHTVIFQYLFIVCNALQGVFIFLLHCAMNEEVKQAFLKKRRVKSSQAGTTTLSMRDATSSTALHTKTPGESVKF